MEQHVKVLAVLSIIMGALMVVLGFGIFALIAGAGAASGEAEAVWITGAVGAIAGGTLVVLSLPAIIGGIGLLKRRGWARIIVMIVAIVSLLNFPFGTAFGVYAIYVLMHDQVKPLFAA
jgi:hypothetical protein